jgi:hypothetical protein
LEHEWLVACGWWLGKSPGCRAILDISSGGENPDYENVMPFLQKQAVE